MKPHKHAEVIKAWADGAKIQGKEDDGVWVDIKCPNWDWDEYRIKPEPKPDTVQYIGIDKYSMRWDSTNVAGRTNLKLTFDGETGKLKSAEVIS